MKEYMKNRPSKNEHYTLSFLDKQFGVEKSAQAQAISQFMGRTYPGANMAASAGSQAPHSLSVHSHASNPLIAAANNGLVTIGLPSDLGTGPSFPKFSS